MLLCFAAQVWEGFFKFIKRQTTLVSTTEEVEGGLLPAISVCPGFRDDDHDYYESMYELADILNNSKGTYLLGS